MFEKDRPRLDLADEPRGRVESGDHRALPRPQRPAQHGDAHRRAEMDQRRDVKQVMAEIMLVRPGDHEVLAGDDGRPREPLRVEPVLLRAVGRRAVDDRLDRGQEAVLKRPQERMAPDPPLRRNHEAEGRKPILVDKVLERHRRSVDDMVDVVDAFGRRRVQAERMQSCPVLAGLDDHALSERRGKAALVGDDRQLRRMIHADRNPGACGHHRPPYCPAGVPPRRSDRLAPECVQAFAEPNAGGAIDAVRRRCISPPCEERRSGPVRHRILFDRTAGRRPLARLIAAVTQRRINPLPRRKPKVRRSICQSGRGRQVEPGRRGVDARSSQVRTTGHGLQLTQQLSKRCNVHHTAHVLRWPVTLRDGRAGYRAGVRKPAMKIEWRASVLCIARIPLTPVPPPFS